ncbi:MAG TPA: MaoC family dehydratase [Jatrophihabitantaceae bacterium]|jgi:acyl dehydratase|nr:MaoC family dehydratase [Jatrophihabitantaceae bacterium]
MRTLRSAEEIKAAAGEILGTSEWLTVEQDRIDRFAEATGDHQWIHVEPSRAAGGPFGATIAHGYLTLSLIPQFGWQIFTVEGARMAVNYGLNKVRFVNPVRVGSRLRSTAQLTEVSEPAGGVQMTITHTIELEGADKPACIAETISRIYF